MPRRFTRGFGGRRGRPRQMEWNGQLFGPTTITVGNQEDLVIVDEITTAKYTNPTLTRIVGTLDIATVPGAAGDAYVRVGVKRLSAEAISAPTTFEPRFDWLFFAGAYVHSAVIPETSVREHSYEGMRRFDIDIRAQRRLASDQTVVMAIRNSAASNVGVRVFLMVRALLKE